MNKELIKKLVITQSTSYNSYRIFSLIIRELKKLDVAYFVNDGNIYATKGDGLHGFPCIVSHMDTVHEICPNKVECIEINGNLVAMDKVECTQVGTGGDDKNGIYICLEILRNTDIAKCVFFRDEETGCNGSYNALITFFSDCNFVLQCDRKGNKDFVINAASTELSSKQFQQTIKTTVSKFGYQFFKHGGLTDVVALKEIGIELCMANISCGYYNPHCENEYINLKDLHNTYNLVFNLVTKFGDVYFKHKGSKRRYNPIVWDYTPKYDYKTKIGDNVCEDCCKVSNVLTYNPSYNMMLCNACKEYYGV